MRAIAGLAVLAAACGTKRHVPDAAARPAADARAKPSDAHAPPDAGPASRLEHAAWNLVDNRHAAHRALGGELVVDAGDIGFARYTRFGLPAPRWHLGQIVAGERAAIADRFASIEVPLPVAAHAQALQLTLRVHADAKQALMIRIDGHKAGTVALDPGWQVVAVPAVRGSFRVGENQLVLETIGGKAAKLALAWLRIGAQHPTIDDDPRAAATFDPLADAIELAGDAELAWYVTIPDGADLVADVAAPCRVEVAARAGDDSLSAGLLGGDRARVELSASAGKVVRLALTARDCPRARIVHAAITLHGAAPVAPPEAEPPRYVILWVMGGLRADRLPVFSPGAHAETPNLDELARSSASFRQVYAQGNEAQASHASLWTALYPAVHGVRLAGAAPRTSILDPRFATIATELAAAGFATAGCTADRDVDGAHGYARGLGELCDAKRDDAKSIVDLALGELAGLRAHPAFTFVGTTDTDAPWTGRVVAKDFGLAPGAMGCSLVPRAGDIERLRALYDAAISSQDEQLGRLVAQLRAWGIWDETMLIVTADHGEELFEDTRCGHGASLRESVVRVPLVIHDPARFTGGTIVDEGAESIDVLPTILAAIGRPALAAAQGDALEGLARGVGRGWPRPSYASMYEYAHAARIGRWTARVGQAGVPVIDDVIADPGETRDLAPTHPVERRMLTDNLGLFLALRARWPKAAWGVTTNVTAAGAAALDRASTP